MRPHRVWFVLPRLLFLGMICLSSRASAESKFFTASHKHGIGSCQGQLQLTDSSLIFASSTHPLNLRKSEIKRIDGDGIIDGTGKTWHFKIEDKSPEDTHNLLFEWFMTSEGSAISSSGRKPEPNPTPNAVSQISGASGNSESAKISDQQSGISLQDRISQPDRSNVSQGAEMARDSTSQPRGTPNLPSAPPIINDRPSLPNPAASPSPDNPSSLWLGFIVVALLLVTIYIWWTVTVRKCPKCKKRNFTVTKVAVIDRWIGSKLVTNRSVTREHSGKSNGKEMDLRFIPSAILPLIPSPKAFVTTSERSISVTFEKIRTEYTCKICQTVWAETRNREVG